MSKGIIVVDKIPENCRNICREKEKGCPFGGMVCRIKLENVMKYVEEGTKPDWCPIKPMPEKIKQASLSDMNYMRGWNDCIDEFLR